MAKHIRLDKKIEIINKKAKNKRGITGYFKISNNNYDYRFIEAPRVYNPGVS